MGTLYLVRHGQASFGAADYDQLSALGQRQCQRLGEHWRARGLRFDAVLIGTLRRHRQSFDAIAQGLGAESAPEAQVVPALDEYDPAAIVRAVHDGPLAPPKSPDDVRRHFRLLREGLLAWMEGRTRPEGLPTHAEFMAGIVAALDRVREQHLGQRVLVVSSGGPISHAVGHVLGTPPPAVVELNLRIRNSAVSEFAFSERKHSLVTFNTLPHLEAPGHEEWVTYA